MAYNLEHLQVQLVEDNPNMRALVKAMLNALGMENVRDYGNGRKAIDAIKEFTPDLVITDWMMAPVDGLEYTRFIRGNIDSPDIYTPIILMTGHTEKWRIIAARDAGVTELYQRPRFLTRFLGFPNWISSESLPSSKVGGTYGSSGESYA